MRRLSGAVALVTVIVTLRSLVAWMSTPGTYPDSERYYNPGDPLHPFHVWEGWGPGVVLQTLYLLPVHLAMAVQVVVVSILWAVLALSLASLVGRRMRWVVLIAALAWSLSPWWVVFDTSVLTEAVTTSACATAGAGLALAYHRRTWGWFLASASVCLAVLTRPFLAALLIPVFMLWAMWRAQERRGALLVAGAVLTVFTGWQLLALQQVQSLPYSYVNTGESPAHVQALDRLAGRGDLHGYLDLARRQGMPKCRAADAIVLSSDTVFEKVGALRRVDTCPGLAPWLHAGGLPWWREFSENTGPTLRELVAPHVWLGESFALYVPKDLRLSRVQGVAGSSWHPVVVTVNGAMLLVSVLVVAAALLRAVGARMALLLTVGWVTVFGVATWGIDGMEYWRHVVPAVSMLVPLAAGLLFAAREGAAPSEGGASFAAAAPTSRSAEPAAG